jgi:hypothetical protein
MRPLILGVALAAGCGDPYRAGDAPPPAPSIALWPDPVVRGDAVGVFIEARGADGAGLVVDSFGGTVCLAPAGPGEPDGGTARCAGVSAQRTIDGSPVVLVAMVQLEAQVESALLVATLELDGAVAASAFRRIERSVDQVDAGEPVDAAPTADGGAEVDAP